MIAHASWIALYVPSDASVPSSADISPSRETVAVSFTFSPTVAPSILAMSAYVALSLLAYALSFHVVSDAVSNVNTASSLLHTVFSVAAAAASPVTFPVDDEPFPRFSVPGASVPGSAPPDASVPGSSLPGSFVPAASVLDSSVEPASSLPDSSVLGSSVSGSSLLISTSVISIVPAYAEFELYWKMISETAPASSMSNANDTWVCPSTKLSVLRNG